MHIVSHYLKKIEAWLLPYTCILCKNLTGHARDLCDACEQQLPTLNHSCLRCAYPFTEPNLSLCCKQCLQQPPPFDTTHALYLYQNPITQFILELKFKHVLVNARILGEKLAHHIQHYWYTQKPLPDIIIPIPLHPARLKERGFNQAIEIARPIAYAINRPLQLNAIQRVKPTLAQATLNAIERQKNIQNAFAVTEKIKNSHVAIIDDVITTGQTITEFCKTLKQSGVSKIDVWCIARAYHPDINANNP